MAVVLPEYFSFTFRVHICFHSRGTYRLFKQSNINNSTKNIKVDGTVLFKGFCV